MVSVSSSEWRRVIAAAAGVMVLTYLPYLWAVAITPPGTHFMGFLHNPDEPNVYLSWMRQAAEGHGLFLDEFTTEPQRPMFTNLFFVGLGCLSRALHLPLVTAYHAARGLCGVLLLCTLYALTSAVSERRSVRWTAFALAAFGSGVGWMAPQLNRILGPFAVSPVDVSGGLVMPESTTFLMLFLLPLFSFSVFLMMAVFGLTLAAEKRGSRRLALLGGLTALLLGNVHSYDILVVYGTLGTWVLALWLWRRRCPASALHVCSLVIVLSLPAVLYQVLTFKLNPVFRQKALTPTLTPPMRDLAATYGLVLLLALAGLIVALRALVRTRGVRGEAIGSALLLILAWTLVGAVVPRLPVSFQRKMVEGWHVPLCVLASFAVGEWLIPVALAALRPIASRRSRPGLRAGLIALLILAVGPSNLKFVGMNLRWLEENNASRLHVLMPPYYLTEAEVETLKWLKQHGTRRETVLCTPLLGSFVPGHGGHVTYIGHWAETLHFAPKWKTTARFFSGGLSQEQAWQLLVRNRIRYVIVSRWERAAAGGAFQPPPFLRPVHKAGDVVIFERRVEEKTRSGGSSSLLPLRLSPQSQDKGLRARARRSPARTVKTRCARLFPATRRAVVASGVSSG